MLILNFRSDYVTFLRNVRNGHFGRKARKQHNNISCADDNYKNRDQKTTADCRNSRERSELQLLCRYNSCKAVADNGEGWKTAFRITKKSRLTSLIQWIQESGRVSELRLLSFYINLSFLSCPDLNLINNWIHFDKDEKLGVGGKG